MKLFDRNEHDKILKIFLAVLISGSTFFTNDLNISAAPLEDGIWAFKEAYTSQASRPDNFTQSITFFSPNFHLDMSGKGKILKDNSMRMGGEFTWTYDNLSEGTTDKTVIPFYIEQVDKTMTIYLKPNDEWSKIFLPALPFSIMNLWETSNSSLFGEDMSAIETVDIVSDDSERRIMNVTLNGTMLVKNLEKATPKNTGTLSSSENEQNRKFTERLKASLQDNTIAFSWTVKKPDWKSVSVSFDLTSIMRAYAQFVLDEAAKGEIVLTDENRRVLEAIGYYSELKSYTDYIGFEESFLSFPNELKYARTNNEIFKDIMDEIISVVKHK